MEKTERDDLEYAGFWIRAWAFLIDGFLIALITTPLSSIIFGGAYIASVDLFMDFLVSSLLPAAYVILFWVYNGATPGKMAISAKVVDAVTGRTSFRSPVYRQVCQLPVIHAAARAGFYLDSVRQEETGLA